MVVVYVLGREGNVRHLQGLVGTHAFLIHKLDQANVAVGNGRNTAHVTDNLLLAQGALPETAGRHHADINQPVREAQRICILKGQVK